MKPTTVISVRGRDRAALLADPEFVYVGRRCAGWPGSIWGNPWKVGGRHPAGGLIETPQHALILYQTETLGVGGAPTLLRSRLPELRGKVLGCWCGDWRPGGPDLCCHAVILARLADAAEEGGERGDG